MPLTSNIKAYTDVADTLHALLERGGGLVRFDSHNDAVRWRHRAYKYRLLLQEANNRSFDFMHLSIENNAVLVRFSNPPIVEDIEGKKVEPEDDLMREAQELAKELGLDD